MKKKLIVMVALALVVMTGVATFSFWPKHENEWPDFLMAKPEAPRYNYEVPNRDYGYRTGNHVPLNLYFKLQSNQEVLADQVNISGDLKKLSQKETRERHGDETLVRVEVVMQGFVLKPQLEVVVTVPYRVDGGEVKKLTLQPIPISTSATYDGVKNEHPKEPPLKLKSEAHMMSTSAMILAGAIGVLVAVGLLIAGRLPRTKKAESSTAGTKLKLPTALADVRKAWDAITNGDKSTAAFTNVARLVRDFFGIKTLTMSDLENASVAHKDQLVRFLSVCEGALWAGEALGDEEIADAGKALAEMEAAVSAALTGATPAVSTDSTATAVA